MAANNEIEKVTELRHRHPPVLAFPETETALQRGLEVLYGAPVTVEVTRRFDDVFSEGALANFGNPGPFEKPLAAIAYVSTTKLTLGMAVFNGEWKDRDLEELREFCGQAGIRLFVVDRLRVYPMKVFERAVLADAYDIPSEVSRMLATRARCPFCGAPLVHHYRIPKHAEVPQSFFACVQFYREQGTGYRCNGFVCSLEGLLEHFDPRIRRLRYTIRAEAREHAEIYDPETFVRHS
jgi:hypothetical protein